MLPKTRGYPTYQITPSADADYPQQVTIFLLRIDEVGKEGERVGYTSPSFIEEELDNDTAKLSKEVWAFQKQQSPMELELLFAQQSGLNHSFFGCPGRASRLVCTGIHSLEKRPDGWILQPVDRAWTEKVDYRNPYSLSFRCRVFR